jgi:hypothetical protein
MSDPYLHERRALVEAVIGGAGQLAPSVRSAIVDRTRGSSDGSAIPHALIPFVDQIATDATLISDGHVAGLTAAGFDEEAVFEAVVAAALGASLARLERVDTLLEGGT